ncbi:unnamed protein product [Urochloa humidicola]
MLRRAQAAWARDMGSGRRRQGVPDLTGRRPAPRRGGMAGGTRHGVRPPLPVQTGAGRVGSGLALAGARAFLLLPAC